MNAIPKIVPIRDRKYLDHLRTLPCFVTGAMGCEPAHLRLLGSGGMGSKPSDARAVPLHWSLHRQQSQMGEPRAWMTWAQEYPEFYFRLIIGRAEQDYEIWRQS